MQTRRTLLAGLAVLPFAARAYAQPMPQAALGMLPEDLTWPGAPPEHLAFMRRVYSAHLARSGKKGRMAADIPDGRLGSVDGAFLLAPAARDCAALLAAARADLATAKVKLDAAALMVEKPAVLSGYRPASHQFKLWAQNFPGYFAETEPLRVALPGGPLGEEAVKLTASFVRRHLAAPGFSLHNSGKAVDFQVTEGGVWLQADRSQRAAWRRSWFFGWLSAAAPAHRFHQNLAIDEPWHWEWRES